MFGIYIYIVLFSLFPHCVLINDFITQSQKKKEAKLSPLFGVWDASEGKCRQNQTSFCNGHVWVSIHAYPSIKMIAYQFWLSGKSEKSLYAWLMVPASLKSFGWKRLFLIKSKCLEVLIKFFFPVTDLHSQFIGKLTFVTFKINKKKSRSNSQQKQKPKNLQTKRACRFCQLSWTIVIYIPISIW